MKKVAMGIVAATMMAVSGDAMLCRLYVDMVKEQIDIAILKGENGMNTDIEKLRAKDAGIKAIVYCDGIVKPEAIAKMKKALKDIK